MITRRFNHWATGWPFQQTNHKTLWIKLDMDDMGQNFDPFPRSHVTMVSHEMPLQPQVCWLNPFSGHLSTAAPLPGILSRVISPWIFNRVLHASFGFVCCFFPPFSYDVAWLCLKCWIPKPVIMIHTYIYNYIYIFIYQPLCWLCNIWYNILWFEKQQRPSSLRR